MDFGLLPPEINSGRMYVGPGSGPMLAAASAWAAMATELNSAAASYQSAVADLGAAWRGASSMAMAASVTPFLEWMTTTAAQAEQTSAQLKSAVIAYENAFTATVPPAVIEANRAQLWSLIATNLLGQNTAAIAATELLYSEMWAQDAAAMYGYASSSAAATTLTAFQTPPPMTRDSRAAIQTADAVSAASTTAGSHSQTVSQLSTAIPQALTNLAASAAAPEAPAEPFFTPAEIYVTALTSFLNGTIGPLSPVKLFSPFGTFFDFGVQTFLAPFNNFNMQVAYGTALGNAAQGIAPPVSSLSPPSGVGVAGAALSAEAGNAGLVGNLSVPPSWVTTAPAIKTVAAVLPQSGLDSSPAMAVGGEGSVVGDMTLSGLAARALAGNAGAGAGSVGGGAGVIAAETATATIIVIPED